MNNILLGAAAIGLTTFFMTFTNTEHPPAAGFSLGLFFNQWDYGTIIVVLGAISFLVTVKHLLRNWLINLCQSSERYESHATSMPAESGNDTC